MTLLFITFTAKHEGIVLPPPSPPVFSAEFEVKPSKLGWVGCVSTQFPVPNSKVMDSATSLCFFLFFYFGPYFISAPGHQVKRLLRVVAESVYMCVCMNARTPAAAILVRLCWNFSCVSQAGATLLRTKLDLLEVFGWARPPSPPNPIFGERRIDFAFRMLWAVTLERVSRCQ